MKKIDETIEKYLMENNVDALKTKLEQQIARLDQIKKTHDQKKAAGQDVENLKKAYDKLRDEHKKTYDDYSKAYDAEKNKKK